jgi:peptide/nickel transport system ATP-binding protein
MEETMQDLKLDVRDLRVRFAGRDGLVDAVRDVSFTLGREKLAIVGESGSGKSTVGRSLLKLHPASARIDARALRFGDTDLLQASEKQMRAIRGQRMSMIMQDPK